MRSIRLTLVSSAFIVAALTLPHTSTADCPYGEAYLLGPYGVGFYTSQFESTTVEPGFNIVTSSVACDLVAGTVSIFHGALWPGTSWILARDVFDVTGVSPGTSVPIVAAIVVDGLIVPNGCGGSGCSAGALVSIRSEGAYDERIEGGVLFGYPTHPIHLELQLALELVAGTPRTIEFKLEGGRAPGGSHDVTAAGSYRIVSALPGATVVSCRGLASVPTPARPASWGQVKAAYR